MGKRKLAAQRFEDEELDNESCLAILGPRERRGSTVVRSICWEQMEFIKCKIVGASLATFGSAKNRSIARQLRFENCVVNSFGGYGAVFDDIVVDGLRTSVSPAIFSGCVFRHVVVKGKCGRFLINRQMSTSNDSERVSEFDSANRDFYEHVDWALDISQLKATCFDIRGSIPAHLIRRNPDEQFIMTRDVALSKDWKKHQPFDAFQYGVSNFVDSGSPENLFVADAGAKDFKEQVAYFQRLKKKGLVT